MCKYCDYVVNPEVSLSHDLAIANFEVNGIDTGFLGVDLYYKYESKSDKRTASIRLYIQPKYDDYYTQCETEINFCPMCGRDLRNLHPVEI